MLAVNFACTVSFHILLEAIIINYDDFLQFRILISAETIRFIRQVNGSLACRTLPPPNSPLIVSIQTLGYQTPDLLGPHQHRQTDYMKTLNQLISLTN